MSQQATPKKRYEDCLTEGFAALRTARNAFCEATFKGTSETACVRAEQLVAYMDAMRDILTAFVADSARPSR